MPKPSTHRDWLGWWGHSYRPVKNQFVLSTLAILTVPQTQQTSSILWAVDLAVPSPWMLLSHLHTWNICHLLNSADVWPSVQYAHCGSPHNLLKLLPLCLSSLFLLAVTLSSSLTVLLSFLKFKILTLYLFWCKGLNPGPVYAKYTLFHWKAPPTFPLFFEHPYHLLALYIILLILWLLLFSAFPL